MTDLMLRRIYNVRGRSWMQMAPKSIITADIAKYRRAKAVLVKVPTA